MICQGDFGGVKEEIYTVQSYPVVSVQKNFHNALTRVIQFVCTHRRSYKTTRKMHCLNIIPFSKSTQINIYPDIRLKYAVYIIGCIKIINLINISLLSFVQSRYLTP